MDIGYNSSDKNFGPVLYSRDKYVEQCKLHLFDDKGTYVLILQSKSEVLSGLLFRLQHLLNPLYSMDPALGNLASKILQWAKLSVKKGVLCAFYIVWKLHKPANFYGLRSRPIASSLGYATAQLSHFLHSQLKDYVFHHPYVLKDSLSLIRKLENIELPPGKRIYFISADVVALYPSIDIDRGLEALKWFMDKFTKIPKNLQNLYLDFARFILENNFVECSALDHPRIFLQKIGTAMGTNFSVVYAIIFMIKLESSVLDDFQHAVLTYDRYIDDIFSLWIGSLDELKIFQDRMNCADPNIRFEFQVSDSSGVMLDLLITLIEDFSGTKLDLSVYRKPGNAYAYLPYGSFHARHVFRGWVKAEVVRLLTHSSNPDNWIRDCRLFFQHLRGRGYPVKEISAIFEQISWNQRQEFLEPRFVQSHLGEEFFTTYQGCVFSMQNAPGLHLFKDRLNLSLTALDDDGKIFPSKAFFAVRGALPLGVSLKR
jgi:hypothetical protein